MLTPPNLLERALAVVSPSWALRRTAARARLDVIERRRASLDLRLRHYEGADRGRRTQAWIAPDSSPASAGRGALHVLRARCRDLRRNNPWAAAAIDDLVSNIIGDGLRVKFTAESDELEGRVKQLWADWADSCACDSSGRNTFGALQAAVCESMIEGGQALVRRRFRQFSDGLPVPLQLQPLEGDHIDTFHDEEVDRTGNRVVQGKAFNAFGRLEGFWLHRNHPGDLYFGSSTSSVFVPASEVLDVYRCERLGQVRGIPWGAPILLRLHDLDHYEHNEALRLAVATAYAGFIHDLSPDSSLTDGNPAGQEANDKGQFADEIEPGTLEYLPNGKTITFPTPPQNEGFEAYTRAQLRAIAKGYGTAYETMTGDYSGFNFSSGRMSWLATQRNFARWRKHIIVPHLCDPALRWFLDAMILAGELAPEERAELSWVWIPPRREMIDPRTEVEAQIAQVRAGFVSLTQVVESLGLDSEAVLAQLAVDLEGARAQGLELSVDGKVQDPGRIGTVNANQNGKADRGLEDLRRLAGELDQLLVDHRRNGHA